MQAPTSSPTQPFTSTRSIWPATPRSRRCTGGCASSRCRSGRFSCSASPLPATPTWSIAGSSPPSRPEISPRPGRRSARTWRQDGASPARRSSGPAECLGRRLGGGRRRRATVRTGFGSHDSLCPRRCRGARAAPAPDAAVMGRVRLRRPAAARKPAPADRDGHPGIRRLDPPPGRGGVDRALGARRRRAARGARLARGRRGPPTAPTSPSSWASRIRSGSRPSSSRRRTWRQRRSGKRSSAVLRRSTTSTAATTARISPISGASAPLLPA